MFDFLCFCKLGERAILPSLEGITLCRKVPLVHYMCLAVLAGWLEAWWAWSGVYQPLDSPKSCVVRWCLTGRAASVKGVQSGELLAGQWAGASLAEWLGANKHSTGPPGWVLVGATPMGNWWWMDVVWGCPGLVLSWNCVNRAARDGRGAGRVNSHECHASTTLVGLLDLWLVCLGWEGHRRPPPWPLELVCSPLTLPLSTLSKCVGNINSGVHPTPVTSSTQGWGNINNIAHPAPICTSSAVYLSQWSRMTCYLERTKTLRKSIQILNLGFQLLSGGNFRYVFLVHHQHNSTGVYTTEKLG